MWPGLLAFHNGDLLSEGKDFQRRAASTAEEHADHREDGEDEFRREFTLLTRCNAALPRQPQASLRC